jgi:hypothetical protein
MNPEGAWHDHRQNKLRGKVRRPGARKIEIGSKRLKRVNDPSAGSPTETLLRLLLPLNDQV